jgi:hypothetical protein
MTRFRKSLRKFLLIVWIRNDILNADLFAKVKAIYEKKSKNLNPEKATLR